jgi:hypothetical protein
MLSLLLGPARKLKHRVHTARGYKPLLHKLDNKHPRMSKHLLPWSKVASSTLPRTSIAQTPPNMPHTHGRITFLPAWQDYQNRSPLPTGVASQRNAMPHSTGFVHVVKILSSWHTKRSRGCSLLTQHPWLP